MEEEAPAPAKEEPVKPRETKSTRPEPRPAKETASKSEPPPEPAKVLRNPKDILTETVVTTLLESPSSVKDCFSKAKDQGWRGGKVEVKFLVSSEGDVQSTRLVGPSDLVGTPLDRCLSDAVDRIAFPPFDAEKPIPIRYVFTAR